MKKKLFAILFIFTFLILPDYAFASGYPNNPDVIKSRILNESKTVSQDILEEIKEEEIENEEISYTIHENARNVPVLMFHEVGYTPNIEYKDSNYILKEGLESKLLYLSGNGYTTITMNDLYNNWTKGTELPEKPVVLTFDDGYASHFTFVKDIFNRFNATGTFYIIQDRLFMDIENRNLDGVRALHNAGMEIGVHSYSHPDFRTLTYDQIYDEINTSKTFLEENLGVRMFTFSYPFGNYNSASIQILKDLGFKTAVTTRSGVGNPNLFNEDSLLKISRYNVDLNTSESDFIKMINGEY